MNVESNSEHFWGYRTDMERNWKHRHSYTQDQVLSCSATKKLCLPWLQLGVGPWNNHFPLIFLIFIEAFNLYYFICCWVIWSSILHFTYWHVTYCIYWQQLVAQTEKCNINNLLFLVQVFTWPLSPVTFALLSFFFLSPLFYAHCFSPTSGITWKLIFSCKATLLTYQVCLYVCE